MPSMKCSHGENCSCHLLQFFDESVSPPPQDSPVAAAVQQGPQMIQSASVVVSQSTSNVSLVSSANPLMSAASANNPLVGGMGMPYGSMMPMYVSYVPVPAGMSNMSAVPPFVYPYMSQMGMIPMHSGMGMAAPYGMPPSGHPVMMPYFYPAMPMAGMIPSEQAAGMQPNTMPAAGMQPYYVSPASSMTSVTSQEVNMQPGAMSQMGMQQNYMYQYQPIAMPMPMMQAVPGGIGGDQNQGLVPVPMPAVDSNGVPSYSVVNQVPSADSSVAHSSVPYVYCSVPQYPYVTPGLGVPTPSQPVATQPLSADNTTESCATESNNAAALPSSMA